MRTGAELTLGDEPDAVPRARHFATAFLSAEPTPIVEDAELLVTELVTNALLHGGPPVTLRLQRLGERIRVEVEDTGRRMPVTVRESTEAMTGRGLSLIASLAKAWGIDGGTAGGKVVWADLEDDGSASIAVAPEVDVDALLAAWSDDPSSEPLYRVSLPDVPTELLLDAKRHIDNVVREFTLAEADRTNFGREMPVQLAVLVETVTKGFANARAEIKRQAVEAAARGAVQTELILTLPLSAADAGEAYLAALDEADRFARAARLLTLATPAAHRVFRRWYVQSLVNQIRAQARGEPPPKPVSFQQRLLAEVTELSTFREVWDRLELLQKVTAELTGAQTVNEIAETVVTNAGVFLGALSVRVFVLGDDDVLRSVAFYGTDVSGLNRYGDIPMEARLPGPLAVRTGKPVFLRNLEQISTQFPELDGIYPSERSLHVAPLVVGDHRLGVLSLAFPASGDFDEDTQVQFVSALADALAQALERALALERAAEATQRLTVANERLSFLADASVALSTSLEYQATLDAVTNLLVPRLADWCAVQVLADGELDTVALLHSDPAKVAWAREISGRFPRNMDAQSGAPEVLRSGRSQLFPEIPEELIERVAVNEEHLKLIRKVGMASAMVVPLTGRSGTLGVVTLIYAESGRRYTEADLRFAEDVARRAALALETAGTLREQSGRLADVTRVAEAAQLAILAPPPAQIGPVALAARYVSAAAEAQIGGDLYEVIARPGAVRLLIGDVRGKGLAAVRTATVVLGQFRAAAADVDDLAEIMTHIDRRLRPYLAEEDFVTALVAEITDDGTFAVAACGHPPALLAADGVVSEIVVEHSLPLGLGAAPTVTTGQLRPGDRLLLHTDGVLEARDPDRRFVDLMTLVAPLSAGGDLQGILDDVLGALHQAVGADLGDDVALLVAEYRGS